MTNLTEDAGNYITTHREFFCTTGLGAAFKMFSLTLALPLSITAILGNVLIILALRKVSSLHPPSKFLLGSLACTDLGVGLISHPIRSGFFLSLQTIQKIVTTFGSFLISRVLCLVVYLC